MSYTQEEQKKIFLETLDSDVVAANVQVACYKTGYNRSTVYEWRKGDAKFEVEWDDICLKWKSRKADEAEDQLRKAVLDRNITAIIFTLKNLRPKDWKDRSEIENVEKRFKDYGEYIKYCEQNGIDPTTGLRVSVGSTPMEQS